MRNIITLLFLLSSFYTIGCDCNKIIDLSDADLVFQGKVKKVTRINSDSTIYYSVIFTKVIRIKGESNITHLNIIVTCLQDACCGINFKRNRTYEVYCIKVNDHLETGYCTATRRIKKWYSI